MSFKQLLYFASIVVGCVALALWAPELRITSMFLSGSLIVVASLCFWRNEKFDAAIEMIKMALFFLGLVAEFFVWGQILPIVLLVFFGTLAMNWFFTR